jgi:hypothetical protein
VPSLIDLACALCLGLALTVGIRAGAAFAVGLFLSVILLVLVVIALPGVLPVWLLAPLALALSIGVKGLLPAQLPGGVWLGGAGGLLWGLLLATALWVSFPARYSPAAGGYQYPAAQTSPLVQQAVADSAVARSLFGLVQSNWLLTRIFLPHLTR